ncbi:MAG: MBL fold metallo-hydrolase [Sphingomonadales bacterium]
MTDEQDPTLKAAIVAVTPFQQNCTLMWCTRTLEGVVVDPGGDVERILDASAKQNIKLIKILITHGHIDHAGGAAELAEKMALPIEGPHADDKFWLDQLAEQATRFGFAGARPFQPQRWLEDGDSVTFGDVTLEVRHCPGHTPGHVAFHHGPSRLAVVGDVLFQGSVGRTDFPRSDQAALIRSIRDNLFPLGDDVAFIPGHGPISTFGQERQTNPFVSDRAVGQA